jgi:hypothetical protein
MDRVGGRLRPAAQKGFKFPAGQSLDRPVEDPFQVV